MNAPMSRVQIKADCDTGGERGENAAKNHLLREVDHDRLADREDHDANARQEPARGRPSQRTAVHDRREREHRGRVQNQRKVNHRPPAQGIAGSAKRGNEKELNHAYPSRQPLSIWLPFTIFFDRGLSVGGTIEGGGIGGRAGGRGRR